jgi:hypothetical protein
MLSLVYLVLVTFTALIGVAIESPSPEPSPAPTPAPELARLGPRATRVSTPFYSFVTTSIPQEKFSIGLGQSGEGTDTFCESTRQ